MSFDTLTVPTTVRNQASQRGSWQKPQAFLFSPTIRLCFICFHTAFMLLCCRSPWFHHCQGWMQRNESRASIIYLRQSGGTMVRKARVQKQKAAVQRRHREQAQIQHPRNSQEGSNRQEQVQVDYRLERGQEDSKQQKWSRISNDAWLQVGRRVGDAQVTEVLMSTGVWVGEERLRTSGGQLEDGRSEFVSANHQWFYICIVWSHINIFTICTMLC